jgi:hypothetical protein
LFGACCPIRENSNNQIPNNKQIPNYKQISMTKISNFKTLAIRNLNIVWSLLLGA